ncbi:phosphate uptake regulator PhoU [Helicobacter fennelliae]|uniref:PhoU domain-containing protein n=1 Tax=Helicobacter fennelliae TaxID=215 RepID=UPI000E02D822|nr:phosphate uptake regulator PhoU [Helicobacter fennelliae]STQ84456.1 phosphate uptake regulator [Helicobacter fennelliae]
MRTIYQEQLQNLQKELNLMYDLCAQAIALNKESLHNLYQKKPTKKTSKKQSELLATSYKILSKLTEKEKSISESCELILLLQQPVAYDLGQITTTFRSVVDIKSIGELAQNNIKTLAKISKQYIPEALFTMAQVSCEMFAILQKELKTQNYAKEKSYKEDLYKKEKKLDLAFAQTQEHIAKELSKTRQKAQVWLDVLIVAKQYEKIGDYIVHLGW